jgi:hypothetical protein
VRAFTDAGHPVIALGQVWRSESASPGLPHEDWDSGHYFVVLGVDDDFVYYQDPYARMCKVFVPRAVFEDHWHQKMGGAATKNRELHHLAIFVRGAAPADRRGDEAQRFAGLDFSRFGTLHLLNLGFPRAVLPFDVMDAMRGLWLEGNLRVSAFFFLRKDAAGNVSGMQGRELAREN